MPRGRPPAARQPVSPQLEAFLSMMVAERGAAANTIESYRRDLQDLSGYLVRAGTALDQASEDDLQKYLARLEANFAPASQARRISALRQFYRFLISEQRRDSDPTSNLDLPKQGLKLPKFLSEAEIAKLLAGDDPVGPEALRLQLAAGAALRNRPAGFRTGRPAA